MRGIIVRLFINLYYVSYLGVRFILLIRKIQRLLIDCQLSNKIDTSIYTVIYLIFQHDFIILLIIIIEHYYIMHTAFRLFICKIQT